MVAKKVSYTKISLILGVIGIAVTVIFGVVGLGPIAAIFGSDNAQNQAGENVVAGRGDVNNQGDANTTNVMQGVSVSGSGNDFVGPGGRKTEISITNNSSDHNEQAAATVKAEATSKFKALAKKYQRLGDLAWLYALNELRTEADTCINSGEYAEAIAQYHVFLEELRAVEGLLENWKKSHQLRAEAGAIADNKRLSSYYEGNLAHDAAQDEFTQHNWPKADAQVKVAIKAYTDYLRLCDAVDYVEADRIYQIKIANKTVVERTGPGGKMTQWKSEARNMACSALKEYLQQSGDFDDAGEVFWQNLSNVIEKGTLDNDGLYWRHTYQMPDQF